MKTRLHGCIAALCGVVLNLALPAPGAESPAAEPPKPAWLKYAEQDYMLGTWGGLRTDLAKRGVDFEFVYFGAGPINLEGGIKEGAVYEGVLLMTLDVDSKKLLNFEGGRFHVSGLNIHSGPEFAKEYVGDLNKASLLDFPDDFRLWELYYEQKFFEGKSTLKFGQLAVDRDFTLPEFYNSLASINFLNQGFFYPTLPFNLWDVPIFPPGYHALNSTPYGVPGVLMRLDPHEKYYVQAAVYDGYPDFIGGGTRINLNEAEGALTYFEIGYKHNQGKNDEGLRGNYKLGGYYHTDEFHDMYDAVRATFSGSGTIEQHSGNYGVYALVDHELYHEVGRDDPARQGLVGFLRAAGAPPKQNLTQLEISGGLVYKGLVPGRDWDTLGLGASYLEISDDVSRAYGSLGLPRPDFEGVLEGSYRAQLTAWWTLQTSLQWIIHPGGKTDPIQNPSDALVLVFQSAFRF